MATTATMTEIGALLKNQYEGPIEVAINTEHELLKLFGEDNRKPSGNGIYFPVQLTYNTSVRSKSEDGAIPVSRLSVEQQARITPTELAGRFRITERVLYNAANDKDAFVADVDFEMENLQRTIKNEIDRQLAGVSVVDTGVYYTGVMTRVNGTTTTSTTVVVDSTQMFNIGDQIAIGTKAELQATPSTAETAIVASITNSTTMELTAAKSLVDNDYIVKGDANGNAWGLELNGLDFGIDDDSTVEFEEIDTSDYPQWTAKVAGNSGNARPLSIEDMQALVTAIELRCGKQPDTIVCHPTHRDQYVQLLFPQTRYMAREPDGGFKGTVTFQHGGREMPFVTSRYAKLGTMYFLDSKSVKKHWSKKPSFMDKDGAVLSRVPDYTMYEATISAQLQLGWRQRFTHGKLTDLST